MALVRKMTRNYTKHKWTLIVLSLRNKSITGYQSADNALVTVTGGRVNRWLDAYEDFVGLTEVRSAQESVTKAETSYRLVQEDRRATQLQLSAVQSKIKSFAMEIEKTKRGTDAYLDLVTKENEIIKEEKEEIEKLTALEEQEKQSFGLLSSALRESHEKERARAERMKYWGVIGSVVGAVIGICGTTINNHLRMKELRNIVSSSTDINQQYREQTLELCKSVNEQYSTVRHFLTNINSQLGLKSENLKSPPKSTVQANTENQSKLNELVAIVRKQEQVFEQEMIEVRKMIAAHATGENVEGNVVYVGPEIEAMLKESEKNLEWKMKLQALGTVTLIYAAAAVTVPVLFKIFGGGS